MSLITIPTSILEIIIKEVKLSFSYLTEKQSNNLIKKLVELWFFIYNRQILDESTINLKGFVNIHSNELLNFYIKIGKKINYKELLSILINCDLVEVNNKFSISRFSKGYRIITNILQNKLSEIEIDPTLIFKSEKTKIYWKRKYNKHKHLIDDIYKCSIDLEGYLNWLNDNIGKDLKPILNDGKVYKRILNSDRIYHYFILALKINLGINWVKVSDEGRLYSSISNLSYTAIPFIKIGWASTVEIDIKNCQPLLLSCLLDKSDDSLKYKSDVESGQFYDKMSTRLGITRDKFKLLSYRYIFFGKNKLQNGKIFEAFKLEYGLVIDQINELKNFECLACRLQQLESNIIVNNIGMLPISKLLRHDQVICLKDNYDLVISQLKKEFNKIGLNPKIK